jgi:BCD family chlorophyll transporter-like MFS transporter
MPEYDPVQMQLLYNLTLPLVIITSIIGLVGMERRITREEHAQFMEKPRVEAKSENAFTVFFKLLRVNDQVRLFFAFVMLSMFGIFLQDAILEVFGAEVFQLAPKDTAEFTQIWGGGILIGLFLIIIVARFQRISKKTVAMIGGVGIAFGLSIIAVAALTVTQSLVSPGLFVMGVSTGLFDFGAMSMMMDMTVEGYAGLYMGMWGFSQGIGQGIANVTSGAYHTIVIEHHVLGPSAAYGVIYGFEALVMILAILVLRNINIQEFKGLSQSDISAVVALETAT